MESNEVENLVLHVVDERLVPVFMQMAANSEARVDRVNAMMRDMTAMINELGKCTALQTESIVRYQSMMDKMITANVEQVSFIKAERDEFSRHLAELKAEYAEIRARYFRMCDDVMRYLESKDRRKAGGVSRTDVRINDK